LHRGITGTKSSNNSQGKQLREFSPRLSSGQVKECALDSGMPGPPSKGHDMKILLQNSQTKHYFSLLGLWTAKPNLAYDFRHSARALDFARVNELTDVQLVIQFDDSQWDNIVPVPLQVATISS